LRLEEPAGSGFKDRESSYSDAEQKRLVYVAATRARDLLIVPKAGTLVKETVSWHLLEGLDPRLVTDVESYEEGSGASWSRPLLPPPEVALEPAPDFERDLSNRWDEAIRESGKRHFSPIGVARAAKEAIEAEEEEETAAPIKDRGRRFGPNSARPFTGRSAG